MSNVHVDWVAGITTRLAAVEQRTTREYADTDERLVSLTRKLDAVVNLLRTIECLRDRIEASDRSGTRPGAESKPEHVGDCTSRACGEVSGRSSTPGQTGVDATHAGGSPAQSSSAGAMAEHDYREGIRTGAEDIAAGADSGPVYVCDFCGRTSRHERDGAAHVRETLCAGGPVSACGGRWRLPHPTPAREQERCGTCRANRGEPCDPTAHEVQDGWQAKPAPAPQAERKCEQQAMDAVIERCKPAPADSCGACKDGWGRTQDHTCELGDNGEPAPADDAEELTPAQIADKVTWLWVAKADPNAAIRLIESDRTRVRKAALEEAARYIDNRHGVRPKALAMGVRALAGNEPAATVKEEKP